MAGALEKGALNPRQLCKSLLRRQKTESGRKEHVDLLAFSSPRSKHAKTTPEFMEELWKRLPVDCHRRSTISNVVKPFHMVDTAFHPTPRGSSLSFQLRKAPVTVAPPAPPVKFMSTSEPIVNSGAHGAFPPKDSGSKQQLRVAFPALPFREHSSV